MNKALQMTIESMRLRCANYYDEPERVTFSRGNIFYKFKIFIFKPRQTHERCPCYLTFEEKESHESNHAFIFCFQVLLSCFSWSKISGDISDTFLDSL